MLQRQFRESIQRSPLSNVLQPKIAAPTSTKPVSNKWSKKARRTPHYVTSSEIMAETVLASTRRNYRGAGKRFYSYLDEAYRMDPTFPKIDEIMRRFELFQLDVIIREYLTAKFNATHNTGKTLNAEACGILYCLACDFGIALSSTLLPSIRKICHGVDNLLDTWYGKRVVGKYPILNPILEAMLDHATPDEQWALLGGHRLCSRSQGMTNNGKVPLPQDYSDDEDDTPPPLYARVRDLRFIPNIDNPRAISVTTHYDKNHPKLTCMEKTVYCSCNTPWTCIVHLAQERFKNKNYHPDSCLFQCRTGDLTYTAYRAIVRSLIAKIGLNPANYGTHSLRSGGVSELYIEGRSSIFIKTFCHWHNMGSIFIYIKPNNPDLLKFVSSFTEYRESRLRETGLSDFVDKHWESMWTEVSQQQKKIRKVRKKARQRVQLTKVPGPVRGSLNNTTFQNRIPIGNQRIQRGPAAQLNSRGTVLHTQHPHQYTDYAKLVKRQRVPKVVQRKQPRSRWTSVRANNPGVTPQQIMNVPSSPLQRVNNKPWVQTSMGFRQNPFK